MKEGDIVWTIDHSIETKGYHADIGPREPHQVKVTKVIGNGFIQASAFNKETGEVDDDSNATVVERENRLYPSERKAYEGYIPALRRELEDLQQQAVAVNNSLIEANIHLSKLPEEVTHGNELQQSGSESTGD